MQFYGDYHTHTNYSDGRGSLEDNIKAAASVGLREIAISDHGFSSPGVGALTLTKFRKQQNELPILREKYPEVSILHTIECNILNYEGKIDLPEDIRDSLDIVIAGFHLSTWPGLRDWLAFIWKGAKSKFFSPSAEQVKRNTAALVNTVKNNALDILVHPNSVLQTNIKDVAQACADYGTLFEINIKHLDSLEPVLEDILSTKVGLIVNSDAHSPKHIGDFSKAQKLISLHNIASSRIANATGRPQFRTQRRT